MTIYRIAQAGEFTFKRDSAGVETIECHGTVFATMNGPMTIRFLEVPGIDTRKVDDAIERARSSGFWSMGKPGPSMSPVFVTVQV